MKPTKCPARKKTNEARKAKQEGGEKAKTKSQGCCVTFKPKKFWAFCTCPNFTI